MKYILIFTALFQIIVLTCNSQSLDLGIKGGSGIANVHTNNIAGSNNFPSIFSYSVNGFLDYKSNGFLGFSVEPGIIKTGWTSDDDISKIKVHYIQLPILSNFYLSKKLYVSIGPEIKYMLNAKDKFSSHTISASDYFHKFELAGVSGITYKIVDHFDIGIRYSYGLTKMINNVVWFEETGDPIKVKDYNQYLQIILKVRLKNWQ